MRSCAALLAASLLLAASPSHANGRFPLSQRLFQDQSNPDRLFLSATLGLLVTQDRGQSWFHVCERTLTPEVREADLLFEPMPDGALLAGVVQPLSISTDCGCAWQPVLGQAATDWVIDIAKAGPGSVLGIVRAPGPPIAYRLEQSTDGGRTWSKVSDLPPRLEAYTLDAAPSNPLRVYVSVMLNPDADAGTTQRTPALLVSDDGGAHWATRPITGATSVEDPYIAAVHPTNPDQVFVRTDGWVPDDETGLDLASDALFYTADAGSSFRETVRQHGKLFGFALSPDASSALVGYGDPVQAARSTYAEELGIYRAAMADLVFTQVLNVPVGCLTWTASGLFACFTENRADLTPFSLGVSSNGSVPATIEGFTPLLRFADVRGPLACNAAACLDDWQTGTDQIAAVCAQLRAECDIDTAANVLTCSSPLGGAGGTGSSGEAGIAGAAPGGATSTSGAGGTVVSGGGAGTSARGGASGARMDTAAQGGSSGGAASSGSCGCRAPRMSGRPGSLFALALVVAFTAWRRLFRRSKNFPRRSGKSAEIRHQWREN